MNYQYLMKSGIEINHNCQRCKEGYFFKLDTNNCYNHETIEKGYYLDIDEILNIGKNVMKNVKLVIIMVI